MKSELANTIYDHADMGHTANQCEKYGMTWGCDENCPVFQSGKCKIEDVGAMRETILTTDRFDSYTKEELNNLYPVLELT